MSIENKFGEEIFKHLKRIKNVIPYSVNFGFALSTKKYYTNDDIWGRELYFRSIFD